LHRRCWTGRQAQVEVWQALAGMQKSGREAASRRVSGRRSRARAQEGGTECGPRRWRRLRRPDAGRPGSTRVGRRHWTEPKASRQGEEELSWAPVKRGGDTAVSIRNSMCVLGTPLSVRSGGTAEPARVIARTVFQRQRTKKINKEKRENGKRTSLSVCLVCDLQSKNTHRIPKKHKDKELKKNRQKTACIIWQQPAKRPLKQRRSSDSPTAGCSTGQRS
jgi:hypothetical protein